MSKKISFFEMSLWMLALLMLVLVISPYAMGWLAKKQYPQMLRHLAHSVQAELHILQYQQSYFKSSIRYRMIFSNQQQLEFKEDIIHGPLYLGLINQSQSPFVAAVVQGKLLQAKGFDEIKPWLQSSALIYQHVMAYDGSATTQAYLPAYQYEMLSTSAMQLQARYSSSKQTFSGVVKLPSYYHKTDDAQLSVQNLELSFMLHASKGLFLEGDGLLSMQQFEYRRNHEQWLLQNLIIQLQNEQQERLNLSAHINVNEAFALNERFTSMQLNMRLSSVDAKTAQQLWREPSDLFDKKIDVIIAALLPIFHQGAKFEIMALNLSSDLGGLDGRFALSSEAALPASSADPLSLLNALNVSLMFSAEKKLMAQIIAWQFLSDAAMQADKQKIKPVQIKQQAEQYLRALVADNWLSLSQQRYRCELEMSQGQAKLNRQMFDPLASIMSKIQSATAVQ